MSATRRCSAALALGAALTILVGSSAGGGTLGARPAAAQVRWEVYVNAFCSSCVLEAPVVVDMLRRRDPNTVRVVGFYMQADETAHFARALGYPKRWRTVGDPNGRRARARGVHEPTVIVHLSGGKVLSHAKVKAPAGKPT